MANRYYIEVKNVGDNGVDKLLAAGVAYEDILVIDSCHPALTLAIREVTGLGFDQVTSSEKTPMHVAARILYVHYAIEEGDMVERISNQFGRKDNDLVNWCNRQYEIRMFGDRDFRMIDQKLRERLEADPAWKPIKPGKAKPPKRRRRTKGRKRRRSSKADIRKAQAAMVERRQMTITWLDDE